MTNIDDPYIRALTLMGREIQARDPEAWAKIPTDPIPPPNQTLMQNVCWALKQYDLDDPALRDLPYTERLKIEGAWR